MNLFRKILNALRKPSEGTPKMITGWKFVNGLWTGIVSYGWMWRRKLSPAEITHLYSGGDPSQIEGGRRLF